MYFPPYKIMFSSFPSRPSLNVFLFWIIDRRVWISLGELWSGPFKLRRMKGQHIYNLACPRRRAMRWGRIFFNYNFTVIQWEMSRQESCAGMRHDKSVCPGSALVSNLSRRSAARYLSYFNKEISWRNFNCMRLGESQCALMRKVKPAFLLPLSSCFEFSRINTKWFGLQWRSFFAHLFERCRF